MRLYTTDSCPIAVVSIRNWGCTDPYTKSTHTNTIIVNSSCTKFGNQTMDEKRRLFSETAFWNYGNFCQRDDSCAKDHTFGVKGAYQCFLGAIMCKPWL